MTSDHHPAEVGEDLAPGTESPPVRRALVFSIIALALMMMAVDGTIVATALDALQHGLHTSVNWAGWTITGYALGFVLMLPISGRLSDRFGNRKVFFGSILAFTLASLCCGLASNIFILIALRVLQAAGGAGFTPSATGIIVDHFGDARDRAVGLFGSIFPMGAMIGPIFGGLFVSYWSWRGIFLVNVPIGLAVAILVMLYVPEDLPGKNRRRTKMDTPGLVLLGLGLLSGMLAASYLGNPDSYLWSLEFVALCITMLVALTLFMCHIHRSSHPFIPPRLIHGPGFGFVNLINVIYGGATVGVLVLVPIYAIHRYGMTALDAGLLLLAQGAAAIIFSSLAAFMLRITGYRLPLYIGAGINTVGMLLLASHPLGGIAPYVWLAGATFLIGVGGGIINPASRNAGLQLEPELAPSIAAIRSMDMQVGKISTISIATAVLASVANPGDVQAWIYLTAAAVLLVCTPLITRIPEHHGAW